MYLKKIDTEKSKNQHESEAHMDSWRSDKMGKGENSIWATSISFIDFYSWNISRKGEQLEKVVQAWKEALVLNRTASIKDTDEVQFNISIV